MCPSEIFVQCPLLVVSVVGQKDEVAAFHEISFPFAFRFGVEFLLLFFVFAHPDFGFLHAGLGIVLVDVAVGIDGDIPEQLYLFPYRDVVVAVPYEYPVGIVVFLLDRIEEFLVRISLPFRHPDDQFSAVIDGTEKFPGGISGIKNHRFYRYFQAFLDIGQFVLQIVHIEDVARYDVIPDRKSAFLVEDEGKPYLGTGRSRAMAAQPAHGVVAVGGDGSGIDIDRGPEILVLLLHHGYELAEERNLEAVIAERAEIIFVVPQGIGTHVAQKIRIHGSSDEVGAGHLRAVGDEGIQDMGKSPREQFLSERLLQKPSDSVFAKTLKRQIGIAEDGMDERPEFSLRPIEPFVVCFDEGKGIVLGIVKDESPGRRLEDAGLPVLGKPQDFPERFDVHLPGMVPGIALVDALCNGSRA